MFILSWNIQKLTAEKARQFAPVIADVINGVTGGKPFVFVVYENKTRADAVLDSIGAGIQASGLTTRWAHLGGSTSVAENLLVIAGNGATVDTPARFDGWRADFAQKSKALYDAQVLEARLRRDHLTASRPTRASVQQAREATVSSVVGDVFKPPEHFRDPIMITARASGQAVKFLALHAPGPDSGGDHEEPYARTYADAVLTNAGGFDLVLGDFNVRTHEVSSGGFVDQGVKLGATTKGSEDGRHTYSRLDRVYARPGYMISTALLSDGQEKDLTDHHCLAIQVEKQHAQKTITSYFPVLPSPARQQEVIYENYDQAFASRVDNLASASDKMDDS
ncbi:MAG TPA: hypothetical protein VIP05_30870 [Burkholderiaceae bacterium]